MGRHAGVPLRRGLGFRVQLARPVHVKPWSPRSRWAAPCWIWQLAYGVYGETWRDTRGSAAGEKAAAAWTSSAARAAIARIFILRTRGDLRSSGCEPPEARTPRVEPQNLCVHSLMSKIEKTVGVGGRLASLRGRTTSLRTQSAIPPPSGSSTPLNAVAEGLIFWIPPYPMFMDPQVSANLLWKKRVSKELYALEHTPKPYHAPSIFAEVAVTASPPPSPFGPARRRGLLVLGPPQRATR